MKAGCEVEAGTDHTLAQVFGASGASHLSEFRTHALAACVDQVALPALAISDARIEAVSLIADTKVVLRFDPFQRTVEPVMKLEPFTVRAKAAPPAVAELGTRLVKVGTGLEAGLIVKTSVSEPVPKALVALSVTLETPAALGVPVIRPVTVLTDNPAGKPTALKELGVLVAVI